MKIKKPMTPAQQNDAMQALANSLVDSWISSGHMMAADMRDRRDITSRSFSEMMTTAIFHFMDTGKHTGY